MIDTVNLAHILAIACIAAISPGPATLAIAGTSMSAGRRYGLALASGVVAAGMIWSAVAAIGLGAVMHANVWLFELIRYFGAFYLLFLAVKSARSALHTRNATATIQRLASPRAAFARGFAVHVMNPKAVLFFGALYSIGVPPDTGPLALLLVFCAVALQGAVLFHGYAIIFSSKMMVNAYMRLRRWFEAVFAIAFAGAAYRMLTARVHNA